MAIDVELMSKLISRLNSERSHLVLGSHETGVYTHMPELRDLVADTVVAFLCARDAEGRSLTQRWEQVGFAGLSNDEQVLLKYRAAGRVWFLDVQRGLGPTCVEVVNLLAPESGPLVLADKGVAASGGATEILVGIAVQMPGYLRLSGGVVGVPGLAPGEALPWLEKLITGLGGPADCAAWPGWWLTHARQAAKAVADLRR